MKTMQTIKKWLIDGCILYTVIAIGFLILGLLTDNTWISIAQFLLILPCALTVSVGLQLFRNQKISKGTRYFSNYAFTVFGFFLFLIIPSGNGKTQMANFLMFILISILYWILFLLYLLVKSRIEKLKKS